MLQTLRQPRYVALSVLMLLVATVCIGLGTWQISRLPASTVPTTTCGTTTTHLRPAWPTFCRSYGTQPAPSHGRHTVPARHGDRQLRAAGQALVRQRNVDDDLGYLVLTPLRTAGGTVLVVRGFISGHRLERSSDRTAAAPAAR